MKRYFHRKASVTKDKTSKNLFLPVIIFFEILIRRHYMKIFKSKRTLYVLGICMGIVFLFVLSCLIRQSKDIHQAKAEDAYYLLYDLKSDDTYEVR